MRLGYKAAYFVGNAIVIAIVYNAQPNVMYTDDGARDGAVQFWFWAAVVRDEGPPVVRGMMRATSRATMFAGSVVSTAAVELGGVPAGARQRPGLCDDQGTAAGGQRSSNDRKRWGCCRWG